MEHKKKLILPGNYIAGLVDGEGCFGLQFRRDIRHEIKNNPIYYEWKTQFIISLRNDEIELIKKIKDVFICGKVISSNKEARYSVQNLDDLYSIIIPFFKKYKLHGKKNKDFKLWIEAVKILYHKKRNAGKIKKGVRGFIKTSWNKENFQRLIKIQKLMQRYKAKRTKGSKWFSVAEEMANSIVKRN